ncbi:MAG TPA: bifunctional DNA-formamidopyrimidine glycosylase/DNA-(apurinic or apyrimidinic site) lyase [Hyphomicrobiaceae bacterium]|nr:bifunctional DNA-formamidopyrimidine glycosylase/DNA-(apurinic or apyrimidinic site) lyase [Hyphomicrobiaceae bacterium]
MPELPEVETVRRGLEPVMQGRRIVRVEQRRADLRFPFPDDFASRLEGRRILTLGRRAKYLVCDVEGGDLLVMHLGMTGRFDIQLPKGGRKQLAEFTYEHGKDSVHDHVVFHMEGGARVTYNDARRFGFMLMFGPGERDDCAVLKGLGVEPLGNELSADYVARRAAGRKTDLKAFLLDQRNIAGLGNIYVCEALYRAGLNPRRKASVLARRGGTATEATQRLVPEIRAVLEAAVRAGGSTLRDFRQADGALGYFQHSFDVYGREGETCHRPGCDGVIRRIVQSGRSTFYCPKCQT